MVRILKMGYRVFLIILGRDAISSPGVVLIGQRHRWVISNQSSNAPVNQRMIVYLLISFGVQLSRASKENLYSPTRSTTNKQVLCISFIWMLLPLVEIASLF